jgi:hypothetical protein
MLHVLQCDLRSRIEMTGALCAAVPEARGVDLGWAGIQEGA